jgi:hypothetical protein
LEGRERGEIRVAEHLKVNEFPAIPGPEGEIVTIPKFTAWACHNIFYYYYYCFTAVTAEGLLEM